MAELYPVNETFLSWQGEGVHLGRKAFFIRLQGCPVKCSWCDSASTWHPQYVPKNIRKALPDELAKEAVESKPDFVVLTGGEPCVHDLVPLVNALKAVKLKVHLETCGAYEIPDGLDWVTVSPKWAKLPVAESLAKADEVKLIIEAADSAQKWTAAVGGAWLAKSVWLHPEWSRRADSSILKAITDFVKANGAPYRAGWQVHKPYMADSLDARARPPAPLGGDPGLGF
ncbi:MAG: 7-carboxy-7-deazaguanine synthase QueE [Opitutae bacterium]